MKNWNWKVGLAALLALALIFGGVTAGVLNSKNFDIQYNDEVLSVVGPDGRAAVGAPATVEISISSALAWKMTASGWRYGGIAFAILCALYLAAYGAGAVNWNGNIFFAALAVAFSMYLASFVSARWNNTVKVSPEQFEAIKGDPAALEALFTGKPLIR